MPVYLWYSLNVPFENFMNSGSKFSQNGSSFLVEFLNANCEEVKELKIDFILMCGL